MRVIKKLTAMVLAIAAMTASMGNVAANAVSVDKAKMAQNASKIESQISSLTTSGKISAADAKLLRSQLAEAVSASNDNITFPMYNSLPSNFVIVDGQRADCHVAFFTYTKRDSTNFRFILNNNIGAPDPTVLANYRYTYNTGVSMTSPSNISSEDTVDGKCYETYVVIPTTLGTNKGLFSFNLGHSFASSIGTPYALSQQIRNKNNKTWNMTGINSLFITETDNEYFRMGLFTPGDVTRDGSINSTDGSYVLSYLVHNYNAGSYCNEAIFVMAADYDQDGSVTLLDVVAMNTAT